MLISFIRTIILYLLTVIALRIMGKRQIGQLEPVELVVTLMISELASIPMGHVSIPLMHGVVPIVTLIVLETFLSFVNLKSRKLRKFLSGAPVILVRNGVVLESELKRLRINLDDLMEELRVSGYADITEIAYAIFETNGGLSVVPKGECRPITTADMNLKQSYNGLPFFLICDGEINETALVLYQKDHAWLKKQLKKKGIDTPKKILFAGIDESGNFYLQRKEGI